MRKPTIYYDAFRNGLIPCEVIRIAADDPYPVSIRLRAARGAYQRGEVLHVALNDVVVKTRVSGGWQKVRTIEPFEGGREYGILG